MKTLEYGGRPEREDRWICWTPPSWPFLKLNTDGAFNSSTGQAKAGGVFRDRDGNWRGDFVMNIGCCSIIEAELWDLFQGLSSVWNGGIRRLQVEVDSACVVHMIQKHLHQVNSHYQVVTGIKTMLAKEWEVSICHIYREANKVFDALANYAGSFPIGYHWLEEAPMEISSFIWQDKIGVAICRNVVLV